MLSIFNLLIIDARKMANFIINEHVITTINVM